MDPEPLISALTELSADLGLFLSNAHPRQDKFSDLLRKAGLVNPWFTEGNIRHRLGVIARDLKREHLEQWLGPYRSRLPDRRNSPVLGIIMPGNIPLAGFHDYLCGLMCGCSMKIRCSGKDSLLLPWLHEELLSFLPANPTDIRFIDGHLHGFDALIATGSSDSEHIFRTYFSQYPNIIRGHRNSLALLDGNESIDELSELWDDILLYFGLGCRSVSMLLLPRHYEFSSLMESSARYAHYADHHRYQSNFRYQHTLKLLGGNPWLENGLIHVCENPDPDSPISVLHYQYYSCPEEALKKTEEMRNQIQCVIHRGGLSHDFISPGKAQLPALSDYADGVDTMDFLLGLK